MSESSRRACTVCTAMTADELTPICDDCADVRRAIREGKPVTTITWDASAQVYEAWGLLSETVRTYLGAYDWHSQARRACQEWVDEHTGATH